MQLLPFLLHNDPRVVNVALVNLLPYTVQTSPQRNLFLIRKLDNAEQETGYVKVFAGLSRAAYDEVRLIRILLRDPTDSADVPHQSTRQAALTALVNLSDSVTTCSKIASLDGYIQWLISQILVSEVRCFRFAELT